MPRPNKRWFLYWLDFARRHGFMATWWNPAQSRIEGAVMLPDGSRARCYGQDREPHLVFYGGTVVEDRRGIRIEPYREPEPFA